MVTLIQKKKKKIVDKSDNPYIRSVIRTGGFSTGERGGLNFFSFLLMDFKAHYECQEKNLLYNNKPCKYRCTNMEKSEVFLVIYVLCEMHNLGKQGGRNDILTYGIKGA